MTSRSRLSGTIWGVISILAGALMAEGGVMEVIVYWPYGQASHVVVGALGAVFSAVLLASGAAFLTRQSFGRRAAVIGAAGMAVVHFLGWLLGFVGIPGVLLGVVYPVVLLLALRAKPDLGAPVLDEGGPTSLDAAGPSDHMRQRTALATH